MLQEYKRSINILLGTGIPLFVIGKFILPCFTNMPGIFAPTILILAFFLMLFGCRALAKAKGYNGIVGLLLGFLTILGLLILVLLKDKNK